MRRLDFNLAFVRLAAREPRLVMAADFWRLLGQLVAAGAKPPIAAALGLGIAGRGIFTIAFAIAQAIALLLQQVGELLPLALVSGIFGQSLQPLLEARAIAAKSFGKIAGCRAERARAG